MPDSDIMAQLRRQWPGVPIVTYNSLNGLTVDPNELPMTQVESLAEAVQTTKISSKKPHQCQNCGQAAALTCTGCKGLPAGIENEVVMTRYCSAACAKQDWKSHQKDCKNAVARRLLYRSASLTKALFYVHQETTFAWDYIERIEIHDSFRVVFFDKEKCDTRKTLLVPFSMVTDLVSDPREREA